MESATGLSTAQLAADARHRKSLTDIWTLTKATWSCLPPCHGRLPNTGDAAYPFF